MVKKRDRDMSDADLLSHVFRDVTPLPGRKISHAPQTPIRSKRSQIFLTPTDRNPKTIHQHHPKLLKVQNGNVPGLDKGLSRKLRQGRLDVEARLDLHGHRQDDAHKELEEFLERAYNAGKRCVLVITGKGTLSQGGGILRKMVPHWLNELPNRGRILSFAHAKPRDGGTGALYILLKGKRS